MAVAFVQAKASTEGSSVTSLATTFDSSTASGNLIHVQTAIWDSDATPPTNFTVTDSKSNTYSNTGAPSVTYSTEARIEVKYAANITGGASHQVTVSPGDTVFMTVGLIELSGAATSSPADGQNSNSGTGTAVTSGSVTPSTNGMFVAGMAYDATGRTMAVNWTGATQRLEIDENNDAAAQNIATKAATASTSDNAGWTLSGSDPWAATIIAYKESTGGSNTTITPGGGSVVLTGAAPTVTGGTVVIRPAGGSVVLTGAAPTRTGGTMLIRPDGGSVVLNGAAPTVTRTENQSITPDGGSVVLGGAAPTVSRTENQFITPAGGSVVLTGAAPTVTDSGATSFTITPDAGIVVLTGAVPILTVSDHRTITPDGGALVLNGAEPTISISGPILITPDAGQIILTGFAPSVVNTGEASRNVGAGRSRKYPKRRITVEIDGETFTISNEQEAVALLDQAREVALQQAKAQALEVIRKRKTASRREKKPLKLSPITLPVPVVKASDSADARAYAATLRDELDEIYRQAAEDAELALHMHYQQILDEEDSLLLLLMVSE